jgi:hypothetical protein
MRFSLTKINGSDLPIEALPSKHLKGSSAIVEEEKILELRRALTGAADPILRGLAENLNLENDAEVSVIATSGLPEPYDAWTASFQGKTSIFFNLSQWTVDALRQDAAPILKHEATHFLLYPLLARESALSHFEQLELIILDEGIAHFIGFTGDRNELFSTWIHHRERSEKELQRAFEKLQSTDCEVEQKEIILQKSNTGPFWEKFGAIAGMFRAAKVFQENGVEGLSQAVRQRRLPANAEACIFTKKI